MMRRHDSSHGPRMGSFLGRVVPSLALVGSLAPLHAALAADAVPLDFTVTYHILSPSPPQIPSYPPPLHLPVRHPAPGGRTGRSLPRPGGGTRAPGGLDLRNVREVRTVLQEAHA